MSFRTIGVITAIVTLVLGAGYLFVGAFFVGRWQIELTGSVLLFVRRMGALYFGLSVIFFLARSAPVSVARPALSAGTAVACSLLALLGVYELTSGGAGQAILASLVVESLLALGYIGILFNERRGVVGG